MASQANPLPKTYTRKLAADVLTTLQLPSAVNALNYTTPTTFLCVTNTQ